MSGDGLVKLCYIQEGDEDFLCTTTFDHWESVRQKIAEISDDATLIDRKRQLLPTVTLIAATLHPVVANQNVQINARLASLHLILHQMLAQPPLCE